jgi:hypothetical protein
MFSLLTAQLATGLRPRKGRRPSFSVDPDRLLYLLQLEDLREAIRV